MGDYAARYRAARGYANLTQDELAKALGVDKATIKRREKPGEPAPKKGERIAVAAICDVPLEFMEHGFSPALLAQLTPESLLSLVEQLLAGLDQAGAGGHTGRPLSPGESDPPDAAAEAGDA